MVDEIDVSETEVEECAGSLVPVPQSPASVVVSGDVDGLINRYDTIKKAAEQVLQENTDYGKIPGCGPKPTLLKPGAEKLATLFHLHPRFVPLREVEDWQSGFFFYRYRCELYALDGTLVGDGIGSCNSKETKYRYRIAAPVCPSCGTEDTIKRSKYPPRDDPEGEPGWYCYGKIGGCGANFPANASEIVDQERGKIENTEPFDLVNTFDKMAQKRAFVAAVLIATGASEFFTQDIEDMESTGESGGDTNKTDREKQRDKKPAQERTARPYAPEVLKAKIFAAVANYRQGGFSYGEKLANYQLAVRSNLETCFAGDSQSTEKRKVVMGYLVGKDSTNDIDDAETKALHSWLEAKKGEQGDWLPNPKSEEEAKSIYLVASGQTKMEI